MTNVFAGVALAITGGLLMGSFAAPMKFTRNWAWENTWLIYAVIGLALIPFAVAAATVPDLLAVYASAGPAVIALTMLFGFGWGMGSVLLGLGVDRLGMAIGFAIIIGLTATTGSLIPLLVLHPDALFSARGASLLAGLAIVISGILLCARAGILKSESRNSPSTSTQYRVGLLICIGAGMLSAMLNLALAFGAPVAQAAMQRGASPSAAQNAIWALAAGTGALANAGYALFLLFRNRTWKKFSANGSGRCLLLAALMGILWMAGISVYGAGAVVLGDLGPVLGWALFMSMIIITGNVWGFLTGEWKGAPSGAVRLNLGGVAALIAAMVVISIAGTL